MPIGAFKLNTIARYIATAVVSARANPGIFSTESVVTTTSSGGTFGGYIEFDQDEFANVVVDPSDTTWYYNSNKAWTIEWWWQRTSTLTATTSPYWFLDGISESVFGIVTDTVTPNNFKFNVGSTTVYTGTVPSSLTHLAIVSTGSSTIELFINGSRVYTGSYTRNDNKRKFLLVTPGFGSTPKLRFDEMRISKSAKYSGSSYTVPTAAFTDDADTLAIFHFNSNYLDNWITGSTARSDAYASYLKLAVPFDHYNQTSDVAHTVSGSGLSVPATKTQGNNSLITNTQVKWTSSPNYLVALHNFATTSVTSLTYALPTSMPAAASGTYVVEGWFRANSGTTNANWCLSSADSGGRWLFGINSGTTFSFGNENNIGIGSGWHHLAIVNTSGTKRFYYDGIYKGAWVSSNTGFSTLHVGQFSSSDHNDFRGHIQDLRVTIGSNRGYTGTNSSSANFTLPSSIISSWTTP